MGMGRVSSSNKLGHKDLISGLLYLSRNPIFSESFSFLCVFFIVAVPTIKGSGQHFHILYSHIERICFPLSENLKILKIKFWVTETINFFYNAKKNAMKKCC